MDRKTEFLLNALVSASWEHPDGQSESLTHEDILANFWPEAEKILGLVNNCLDEILPSVPWEVAVLGVKWGTDDPMEAPPLTSNREQAWDFPGWSVEKWGNQVLIWPRGPGSGGAGATQIWFQEAPEFLQEIHKELVKNRITH